MLHSSSPIRGIPPASIGYSDALISTAAEHRAGLFMENGVVGVGELGLWAASGPLALSVSGRERLGAKDPFHDRGLFEVQSLSARLLVGNAALTVGRTQLHLAPGAVGGLTISTTARPVDMVSLTMDRPVTLPWLLRYAGPVRGTIFVADLGERQHFPNSKFSGYKLSILPHDRFELGATILTQWGGKGSPEVRFGDIVRDHLPFLESGGGGVLQVSNKLASVDGRLRLSNRHGLTIYGEVAADDLDRERLISGIFEDGAQLLGVHLPAVGVDGRWELQLEGRRTGIRFYNHHQFRSGLTVDGALIGDALGPNAMASSFRVSRGMGASGGAGQLELALAVERRSYDQWKLDFPPLEFVLIQKHPAEWRNRVTLGWVGRRGATTNFHVRVAGERIVNWAGELGRTRWGSVTELGTSVRF